MDICLMIEGQEGVTWEQWVALARACEQHGFEGLFRSDHYLAFARQNERGALDPWATISALAAVTDRIRLGTMVSPVTFRHPANLAKLVVTADYVSGGRVELGMGAGWFEEEHRAFGFPFPDTRERMDMLAEQVEIVHGLWGGEGDVFSFAGTHYRLDACPALPKPLQDPHPPLIMGGRCGAAFRRPRRPVGRRVRRRLRGSRPRRRSGSTESRQRARRSDVTRERSGVPSSRRPSSARTKQRYDVEPPSSSSGRSMTVTRTRISPTFERPT